MNQRPSLWQLLGIKCPIVQAPMAGVATPALAAAVSNAGALGSLGAGSSSVLKTREMIAATRVRTDLPFNVNFFCHQPATRDTQREAAWLDYLRPFFNEFHVEPPVELTLRYRSFIENRAMLDMLIADRPPVVSFIFGVPPVDWVSALHEAGIVVLGCATTLEEAWQVELAGMDAIVAQGVEAGGHRGIFDPVQDDPQLKTHDLVRLLAAHCHLPIIAAGGIMNGQAMAAMMRSGASGVQMGTAFIASPESSARDAHRAALCVGEEQTTQVTDVISGRPARGLVNRMHTEVAGIDRLKLPDYPIAYDAGKALAVAAAACGCYDFSAFWAGQGVSQVRALPAKELVAMLVREWHEASVMFRENWK